VGAALVEPAEAERLGKRVQERVRTVNESLEEEEKHARAKAKAAQSDDARAALATAKQAAIDKLLTAEYAGVSTASPPPPPPLPPPPEAKAPLLRRVSRFHPPPNVEPLPSHVATPCAECGELLSDWLDDIFFEPIAANVERWEDVDDFWDVRTLELVEESVRKNEGAEAEEAAQIARTRLLLNGLVDRKMLGLLRDVERRAAEQVALARADRDCARIDAWDELEKKYFAHRVPVPDAELQLRSRMQVLQHENAELQRLLSEAQEALERAQNGA
jgi:hypothetical protein